MAAPSSGRLNVERVAARTTSAARGTPATPLLVSISVSIIINGTPAICATKTLHNDRYSVDPSRLKLYPVGSTKPTMFLGTPKRSMISSDLGSAASELAVVNAIRNGSRIAFANARNGTLIRYDTAPT